MHFAEGSAMPPLLLKLIFDRIESGRPMPFFVRPVARAIARAGQEPRWCCRTCSASSTTWKASSASSEWFAGTAFSAADIQMSFPLEAASVRGGLDAGRPKLWGFLQRIHARPAYQRALEKGGKYELLR